MVTLNKPAAGDTDWTTEVNDNWTTLENSLATLGKLELVEKKTLGASTQSTTFSSLDGDADEFYVLLLKLKNGSASSMYVEIRPNGSSTNMDYEGYGLSGGVFSTGVGSGGLFCQASASGESFATLFISASKANTTRRLWHSLNTRNNGSGDCIGEGWWVVWNETSTNITSLEVRASVASGLGQNTVIALYKVKTS